MIPEPGSPDVVAGVRRRLGGVVGLLTLTLLLGSSTPSLATTTAPANPPPAVIAPLAPPTVLGREPWPPTYRTIQPTIPVTLPRTGDGSTASAPPLGAPVAGIGPALARFTSELGRPAPGPWRVR